MPTTLSLDDSVGGLHWHDADVYGTDQINAIHDPQGGNTEKQPTSIPSPFARMDLVRSAFLNLSQSPTLTGTDNDQRIVSDCFDVGQILFNFDSFRQFVTITPWDIKTDLGRLLNSPIEGHRRLGDALKLYLDQDKSQYNFDKIQRLFIISYGGKVIGGTSPKTLFFSSGNDLSWLDIRFGNDRVFDRHPCPLYLRDIEYQKFWYALQDPAITPNFRTLFTELDDYLTTSKRLLQQTNPTLYSQHIANSQGVSLLTPLAFESAFDILDTGQAGNVVEVLGMDLRKKKPNTGAIGTVSDFIINSPKYAGLYPDQPRPMALPPKGKFHKRNFVYVPQTAWDPENPVPEFTTESWRDNQRPLPGQPGNYPWLTTSDFLEPYLIRLPYPTDRTRFFDGNLNVSDTEKGYLLPLTKDFFDFFDVQDLLDGKVRLRMEVLAGGSGVRVTLDIPVTATSQPGNQFINYERLYKIALDPANAPFADPTKYEGGVIIEDSFTVNIYPFVRSGKVSVTPDYRIQLIESGYGKRNSYSLSYVQQRQNQPALPDAQHKRTERQATSDGSSEYHVLRHEFDYIQAAIQTDSRTLQGILIPRWARYDGGGKQYAFAVDFGTTNTHVEYSVDRQSPRPFDITVNQRQVGTLVAPTFYNPALFELFFLFDLEFVPPTLGPGNRDQFPTRTAIAEPSSLDVTQSTYTLADFNIPFYVERQAAGNNVVTPNLKWAKGSNQTSRRVQAFLEELMFLIKNKVIYEGGDLAQTKLFWFFPASMTPGRIADFQRIWRTLFQTHINPTTEPQSISESIAPFYYYRQSNPTLSSAARPVVNIDIGGGTSDVVIYQQNNPQVLTSFRFAGNAIYGDAFSEFGAAENNGFVRRYENKIRNLIAKLSKLKENNDRIRSENRSEEIVAFWFSIEKSDEVPDKRLLSFNGMLADDDQMRIVFVLFYTALLYHVARLMKQKGMGLPNAVTFSGTGSKFLPIISSDDNLLRNLSEKIFERVYDQKFDTRSRLTVYTDKARPKEVTCKGALMNSAGQQVNTDDIKYVYPAMATDSRETLTYEDLNDPAVTADILKEVENFIDFFFRLDGAFSFEDYLNIDSQALRIARDELPNHLDTFLMDGIQRKRDEISSAGKSLEETLFFYPLVGAINNLSFRISQTFGTAD